MQVRRMGEGYNKKGYKVGFVGQSGNARKLPRSEAHLHFEIRKNGKTLDPEHFLNSPCPPDFTGV